MPLEGSTAVDDLIRGRVAFENSLIDDFVLLKSDGFPTYHLANVADDHAMEITHVFRAEEWLPSAPRHVLIYGALGWDPPLFAHLPIILAPDRSKLSKRHGATSVLDYREMGYLPAALLNFLAILGWSLDDKTEVFSSRDLIKHFSIQRVSKAGAVFSHEKLNWMNGYYIREMSDQELADALLEHWRSYPAPEILQLPDREYLVKIVPLVQERLKTLNDAAPLLPFFFAQRAEYETAELVQRKMDVQGTKDALEKARAVLGTLQPFDSTSIGAR